MVHDSEFVLTELTIALPRGASHLTPFAPEDRARQIQTNIGSAATSIGKLADRQFRLELLDPSAPGGRPARRFIEARYNDIFGSHVRVRYPRLLVLSDSRGRVVAAVGIRRACDGPLFLEHYLDTSAEKAIAALSAGSVSRDAIVELGSFAAGSSRAAMYVIAGMAAYMRQQSFSHAMVTSTGRLRRLFAHFDFDLMCLGEARKDALPNDGSDWGLYYDDGPRVLVGLVHQCFEAVLRDRNRQNVASRVAILDDLILQAQALSPC
ncbi:MAG: thermostable hemolysin [Hyphomicrobiales bacterium]